ncbi:MAG: hypothetical protein QOF78_2593 [Phycisphaerales bacterium]|nr:hypothetical protein [Phycisphaerales bacterium]
MVIVFFNMRREAQRSLYSLTKAYQAGVADLDYEVICVDNGSREPLSQETVAAFGPQFRYHFLDSQSKSPAEAINFGVAQARAQHVMIIPDGANILSPRIFYFTQMAIRQFADPLVGAVAFMLGPPRVSEAPPGEGAPTWDQATEDARLAGIDWKRNGYQLFRLTSTFRDGTPAWFGCQFENTCFTMRKSTFEKLGGFDPAFQSPGGGFVALDFFQRAMALQQLTYVMLLGEATFHQHHGGASSAAKPEDRVIDAFVKEYHAIRNADFEVVVRLPIYLGQFTPESMHIAQLAARHGFEWWLNELRSTAT